MINDAGRDPGVDVLRAVAMAGVVGGHWLVTGLVVGPDGVLRPESPLTAVPALSPVTWVLETLGLFFFAGGFAAAVSAGRRGDCRAPGAGVRPGPVPTGRLVGGAVRLVPTKLSRPLAALVAAWTVALAIAAAAGVPAGTLTTVALLVASPLWFLLPYLALRAVTGPLIRIVDRAGPGILPAAGVAVVAADDLGLLPGWTAVLAAWSVPWTLGVAMARGRLGGRRAGVVGARRAGALLLGAGVLAGAALVLGAGYPASAVGVPGAARSNLNPPSLFAVALAVAQIGIFLLVRERLAGIRPGRVVTAVNRAALPVYLGHQSVLIAVTGVVALVAPRAPGLLTAPDGPGWVLARVAWLPLFAAVLVTVVRGGTIRSGGRCRGAPVQKR